jgi:DNA-binding CsgD family transcriptional regulator
MPDLGFRRVGARGGGTGDGTGPPGATDDTSGLIRVHRAREAVHLVGEVRELGATTEAGRRHLVDGLLRLLGGAIGGAVLDTSYAPGLKRGIAHATLAGFDRQIIEVFDTHHTQGSDFNPFHGAAMRRFASGEKPPVLTSSNTELVARGEWDGSEWINEYVRPARVAHFICTLRMVGVAAATGVGFMRAAGDRPFSEEDREILHLVHLGVGRFFAEPSPGAGLPPRIRETLDVLLTGVSDKEIAAQLGISPHTVRQYVKAILRAYGVSSRAQLIARGAR